jgi:hypothetical protein
MFNYVVPNDPSALADEIARTAAHLAAGTHRLLACIRAFDASEEWGHQGALSCAHWLTWRIRLAPGAAREKVRVARALGALPRIDDALCRGVLSYSQVRALTRVATAQNEELLLNMAQACTAAQLERFCRSIRRAVAITEDGDRLDEHRTFREETMENGMVRLSVVLHADEAALVMKAIEHARRPPASSRPSDPVPAGVPEETRQRLPPRTDALISVAETYLAYHDATDRGGPRTHIFLHVDQDPIAPEGTLAATLDDGTRVSAEAFRRLSCDATVVPVHHHPTGSQLDLGRRTRTVSPALHRALLLRDRGCAFPACPHTLFLHAHHIQHWVHGGPTSLINLVNLCGSHHRLVHEGGFGIRRDGDGRVVFTGKRGEVIAIAPAPCEVEGDGADALAAWNEESGLEIDAQTGFPGWDGERIDYAWAVDAVLREGIAT